MPIAVEDPHRVNRGVADARLDGKCLDPQILPRFDDGRRHELRVTMGRPVVS